MNKEEKELEARKKEQAKELVGLLMKLSFWTNVILWVVIAFLPEMISIFLSFAWLGLNICSFVTAIIQIAKYPKKAFAIVVLVISSIWLLLFFSGFAGAM